MNYLPADHTYALCVYGDSPYLEECIRSLEGQTVKSRILIATSTPSEYIRKTAEKHGLEVYANPEKKGIGPDWNFAYKQAGTKLVTIAHQDDIYEPGYTEKMLEQMNSAKEPIIWFCDYRELRNGEKVHDNKNLKIKRLMLFPLKGKAFRNSRFVRRRILSMGSPICCPAVTYVKEKTGEEPFSTTMKVSLDWDQWEKLSRKRGAFLYCPEPLMCHRVHEESATTELIASKTRETEDLEMFRRFWPGPVARWLEKRYSASEKSNQVK